MRTNILWKIILVLAITALCVFFYFHKGLNLGLDLKGGVHLVMIMDPSPHVKTTVNNDARMLEEELTKRNIAFDAVSRHGEKPGVIVVQGKNPSLGPEVDRIVDESLSRYSFESVDMGHFELTMKDHHLQEMENFAVEQSVEVIRNRIDKYGVSEPVINRQGIGSRRIIVQLPGVEDSTEIKRLIGKAAHLEWRLEVEPIGGRSTRQEIVDFFQGNVPPDVEIVRGSSEKYGGERWFALKTTGPVSGADLQQVFVDADEYGQPQVAFVLTPAAGQKFQKFTGEHIGAPLAIVLDNLVITDPIIEDAIPDRGVIRGNFTQREVKDLVLQLKSGALPCIPSFAEERTVGPSLGLTSIRRGTLSGTVGMILVLIFMLLYYRASGINANVCLLLNFVLLMGIMSIFGMTLTVPGIAGIILTIGMAIDANVLIFERIKEELYEKKTVLTAIANGFGKAFITIFDSNVTTLIAALFLLEFGSGPVRGFAVTLTVGLLASMFTAVFVSRLIYEIVVDRRTRGGVAPKTLSVGPTGLFRNLNIPFMKVRSIFAVISIVVILVGMWSWLYPAFQTKGANITRWSLGDLGFNWGIDFKGGQEIQMHFTHPVDVREVEKTLREKAEGSLTAVQFGAADDNEILIRMSATDEQGEMLGEDALAERGDRILDALRSEELKKAVSDGKLDLNTSDTKIVEELIARAFISGELSGTDEQAESLALAIADYRKEHAGCLPSIDVLKGIDGMSDAMFGYLSRNVVVGDFAILRIDTVGPTVGKELKNKALQAIIGSLIGILLYAWFRFQLRFSMGAILALVHDTLVMLGLVALFQVEINLPTIAAFLALLGYSINDTIVVFDRIREHMKRDRKTEDVTLFNRAINETLSRTAITSLTTFFVVLAMLLYGGEVLFSFSFVLVVGVIVGTYSSIFVASPGVLLWNRMGLQRLVTRRKVR